MKQIDVLSDDVLLEIFDFYVRRTISSTRKDIEAWQTLVHVCRRWRWLAFRSTRRLNLRLCCTAKTPAKDTLDVWPALPLIVRGYMTSSSGTDNVITALGQSNRVCEVDFSDSAGREMENVLAAMQVPFPKLTDLRLFSYSKTSPIIPDSFLGGSTPLLRYFELDGIPFPGLPKLVLSANHLVSLHLSNIPHSGYISPEAIVTLLSALALSSLETLFLGFESPRSHPGWQSRSLLPPKRSIIPALNNFHFKGVTEYLEELVTHIDTPQLDELHITFLNQIDFDCPRLAQFIDRTPALRALDQARVRFDNRTASVKLRSRTSQSGLEGLEIAISCKEPDWQLSSIEQVCNFSLPPLSTVEDLYIEDNYWQQMLANFAIRYTEDNYWQKLRENDAIENTLWLELLLPFTAVKNLYISMELAPGIAAALQELAGVRIAEVLPNLQNIFLEKPEASEPVPNIGQFVAARQLSERPVTISEWDKSLRYGIDGIHLAS